MIESKNITLDKSKHETQSHEGLEDESPVQRGDFKVPCVCFFFRRSNHFNKRGRKIGIFLNNSTPQRPVFCFQVLRG